MILHKTNGEEGCWYNQGLLGIKQALLLIQENIFWNYTNGIPHEDHLTLALVAPSAGIFGWLHSVCMKWSDCSYNSPHMLTLMMKESFTLMSPVTSLYILHLAKYPFSFYPCMQFYRCTHFHHDWPRSAQDRHPAQGTKWVGKEETKMVCRLLYPKKRTQSSLFNWW